MKTCSRLFSCGFALAFSALVPMIVGTQFIAMPAVADDALPEPCTPNVQSLECELHTQWLAMQQHFWNLEWGHAYQHGLSLMTAEPPAAQGSSVWALKVWLNMGLDYLDPNLTQAQAEAQILGQGQFDVAAIHQLSDTVLYHQNEETGEVITQEVALLAAAGVATGSTGTSVALAAVMLRTTVRDTHGHEVIVYHVNPLEVNKTLAEAVSIVQMMHEAIGGEEGGVAGGGAGPGNQGGGSGELPPVITPPGSGLVPCLWAPPGQPQMSAECCWCYANAQAAYGGCAGVWKAAFAACMPSWEQLLLGLGCPTCMGAIAAKLWLLPGGKAGIAFACGVCLGGWIYKFTQCYLEATGKEDACKSNAVADRNKCLQDHGCSLPTP